MKKKTRRLMTMTLTICIGLMLSAGMASATIMTSDGTPVEPGNPLAPETMIKSNAIEGMEITYIIPPFDPDDTNSGHESTDAISTGEETSLIPAQTELYGAGYTIAGWSVKSITNAPDPAAEGAKDDLVLEPHTIVPIQYTIEYYDSDQTTLLHRDENVTVENAEQFMTPAPTRDGYVFSHWIPAISGGKYSADVAISPYFLTAEGHPDQDFVIKFYAAWEKPSAPAPEPEPELDDSPKAGDSTSAALPALLMTAAIIALISLRKNDDSVSGITDHTS